MNAPRQSNRAMIVVTLLTVAVLAVIGAVALIVHDDDATPTAIVPTVPHTTAPAPTAPTHTAPPAPAIPHEVVAAAAPTEFTITGPKFTIKAHVCSMAAVFPLDPPGEQHHTVCWVKKGFGFRPSSNSATSYVLGHSWAEDDQEVLNKASEPVTKQILGTKPVPRDRVPTYPTSVLNGYTIVLSTPSGTLTYKVHDTYAVAKNKLGFVKSTMNQKVPNRLVVITCAELHHRDYDFNVVITAYLWSSVARHTVTTA